MNLSGLGLGPALLSLEALDGHVMHGSPTSQGQDTSQHSHRLE